MATKPRLENLLVKEIEYGERFREDFGDLTAFAAKIKMKGLIQPVAVLATPGEPKPYLLLTGGRRYAATVLLGETSIPARIYEGEMSELDRREIELMENVERLNMNFAEASRLTKAIDDLNAERFGRATGSDEGHSQRDTAALLGVSHTKVSQDIQLAKELEVNPALEGQAKNRSEALRMMKRRGEQVLRDESAKKFQERVEVHGTDAMKKQLAACYIVRDAFEGLEGIPDSMYSMIEVDPPYGVDLNSNKKNSEDLQMSEYRDVPAAEYAEWLGRLFKECYRVLLPSGWIVCWFGSRWDAVVRSKMREAGFKVPDIPGVWFKSHFAGPVMQPEYNLGSNHEDFFYGRKGEAVIRRQGRQNVFDYQPVNPARKVHTTERPIEMIQDVVSTFCTPGGRILIPFLGSGNTLLAAINLGITGAGFDLSEQFRTNYIARVAAGEIGKYSSYA